jgi:L-alanine-DL-glutamate epimerase-like enolase superfamily enzyme
LTYATGSRTPYPWEDLKRKLDIYRDAGFRAAKLGAGWFNHKTEESFASTNVSTWVDIESEKARIWREHVGPEFKICLDGHMGNVDADKRAWDVATAQSVLKAIEPHDVFFFEEPLDYRDREGYAELTRATAIPVAGGEVLTTREEFQAWADDGALDIAQPDAAVVGISGFLDIARMFAARGRRIAPHCWESGPAVMQNIHAAFACPNVCIVEVPPVPGGLLTDVYGDGYHFHDGYLLPPDAPGLGVKLNEGIKHKYRFIPGSGEWNMVPGMPNYL